MAEEWLDCPALGPGWKRRECFRKTEASCGRSDTYYQSPGGEQIRSKAALTRFLGPDCDLSCFDFKHGILQSAPARASSPESRRRAGPDKAEPSVQEKRPLEARLDPPAPQGPVARRRARPGRRRLWALCEDCRARSDALSPEQRTARPGGRGDCRACQGAEDGGVGPACEVQPPRLPRSPRAQSHRLSVMGCQTKENCGDCECRGRPGLPRPGKGAQQRCPEEYGRPGPGAFISCRPGRRELESCGDRAPGAASPAPAGFSPGLAGQGADGAQGRPSPKEEESLGKGEGEEEVEAAGAHTPVITEIYSLCGATPTAAGPHAGLDSGLLEFRRELNELPLPAHWEVLPPRGPDLGIVQRSPLSTVAAAVIHIQPGLSFHVVVQGVPVPPTHELYSAHPLRLSTADEVVELICSLEAYRLCPGWPGSAQRGARSPDCHVLVYGGRCPACFPCLPTSCCNCSGLPQPSRASERTS
ncbi:methyl-CpG-binding domain protein 1-like [Dromiciops gliroides]|uniref:methyl-CpG-binding domain protein 1-like n=1 Tax=Dromiciops gliroides TaxID=33562 RepID=UPI001CC64B8F|nr:methyl-CpG-binding domain protein 1-like [Dromiciops gliroides]